MMRMMRGFRPSFVLVLLLSSSPIAHSQSPQLPPAPPAPAQKGAISGTVLDTTTGKPVAGATVALTGTGSGTGATPGALIRLRQITDDLGRFVFFELPAATNYTLTAGKAGYFEGAFGRRPDAGGSGVTRRISLLAGEWFRDAKIELSSPGAINGSVRDEAGEAVVDVFVRVYTEVFIAGNRQLLSGIGTRTDDRGHFRVPNLPPGRYVVGVPSVQHAVPADLDPATRAGISAGAVAIAESQGLPNQLTRDAVFPLDPSHRLVVRPYAPAPLAAGRAQVYPMMFHPGTRSVREATVIEMKPGEERTAIDIQLRPVPAFKVSGRLDGAADAIGGMPVRLILQGAESLGLGSEAATTVAKADGTFTFLNVASGTYTVIANRSVAGYSYRPTGAPFAPWSTPPGAQFNSSSSQSITGGLQGTSLLVQTMAGPPQAGRQTVTVAGRDVTDLRVPLLNGITISGTVEYDLTRPGSEAARPLPVSGFSAEPANGDPSLGVLRSSGNVGPPEQRTLLKSFSVSGVPPGQFLLRPPLGSGTVKSITWGGRDFTYTPFDTTGGADITGIVVTLTDTTGTLRGTVRDRAGQPAQTATVIMFPAEREQWTNFGIRPARMATTAATTGGTFALSLPGGDYLLVAVDSAYGDRWKDPAFLAAAARVATRVQLGWGESKVQDIVVQEVR